MGEESPTHASAPVGAVFLSYASQDAEAAKRICDALRAAGIEVWFDQSELRGGDAWDQSIRKQIKTCALFVPIISANTHARAEGYFRLEWNLAVDRCQRLAADKAFLVPVVVDDTPDDDERVPEKFRDVQWTRLPAGEAPPGFVRRVQQLLSGEVSASPRIARAPSVGASRRSSRFRPAWLALAVVLAAVAAYLLVEKPWIAKPPQPVAFAPPPHSIAVLPFVDMSEKHDQEYFSDGLSEELIDSLTKIHDLYVPARTSSFYFKGKPTTVSEIAKALSVANVLEGSVRKSGNRLRITAQLVRADNGYHLWSETYDRQFDDIFKIQDEIAAAVVTALRVSLLEPAEPHQAPTVSTEAYTLYLQARAIAQTAPQRGDYQRAIEYLQRALTLDPAFARAWAALASYQAFAYEYYNIGTLDEVRSGSTRAASRALELNPMLSDGYASRAQIFYDLEWNWSGARDAIGRALELDARNADAYQWASSISRIQGQFAQAIDLAREAVAHDPLNAWSYGTVGNACLAGGRLDDAEAAWRKAVELAPAMSQMHLMLGIALVANHKPAAALEQMDLETDERYRDVGRALALDALGRKNEADYALAIAEEKYAGVVEYPIAQVYARRPDPDKAFAWLERAYQLHDGWVPWIPWDPLLNDLRKDPRFAALLHKLNLSS